MITFLTSSFFVNTDGDVSKPESLDSSFDFVENLRFFWKQNSNMVIFASDPEDSAMSEHLSENIHMVFTDAGLMIKEIRIFDMRAVKKYADAHECDLETAARGAIKEYVEWADVIHTAGGHAPTENKFMKLCDLKGALGISGLGISSNFDGILLGLSAGSMNAADNVYLIPELSGENSDPDYVRYSEGLGITALNIIPHAQYLRQTVLDNQRMIEDIAYNDSVGHRFYLINDGSYFIINNGVTQFFGEGQILEDKCYRPLKSGIISTESLLIRAFYDDYVRLTESFVDGAYDLVFEFNPYDGHIQFYYSSELFISRGIVPVKLNSYKEVCQLFSENMIVDEEKVPALEQLAIPVVNGDLFEKGEYVRTAHIATEGGVSAESIRIRPIDNNSQRLLFTVANISFALDHDWMTDEYSRTGFENAVKRKLGEINIADGYSIVYTNIEGFKAINALFGTGSGDMYIFHERDVLKEVFKPLVIARFDADHFVLLTQTKNITEENMKILATQIHQDGYQQYQFKIQCGVYNISDATESVYYMSDCAKLAEKSLREKSAASYVIYDDRMNSEYLDRNVLISELDEALSNNEFKTYYQPIVDAKTHEIVSAEALIRWQHPLRGMIPPYKFVEAFEEKGLISKIDYFMANRVINFNCCRRLDKKKVVPCSVNLSRMDFYDIRFIEKVMRELLSIDGVEELIKFEVTESAYADLEKNATDTLKKMHELKIPILLDDFGSGMSSMSTLESFDFDIIKLDMGFVRKIGVSTKAENIIRAIINLSHSIGAKVVAEGVETKEHLDFLTEAGCDMIQGYYFYKPMPEEDYERLLDEE